MYKRYLIRKHPPVNKCISRRLITQSFFGDQPFSMATIKDLGDATKPEIFQFLVHTKTVTVPLNLDYDEFYSLSGGASHSLQKMVYKVNMLSEDVDPIVVGRVHNYYDKDSTVAVLELIFESENSIDRFPFPDWVGDDVTDNENYTDKHFRRVN